MADGISLREFGRQIGVSCEAVRKAVADGRIPKEAVGQTRLSTGATRPCIVDAALAASSWGKNRDENQVRDKATMAAGAKRGWAARRGEPAPPEAPPQPATDPSPAPRQSNVPTQAESKAVTAAYQARTARIEYEQLIGSLVNADQVKAGYVGMITSARNRLMGVPSKAKAKIPALTVRDIEALEDLIAEALEDVALGR